MDLYQAMKAAGSKAEALQEEFNALAKALPADTPLPRHHVVALYTVTKLLAEARRNFEAKVVEIQSLVPPGRRRSLDAKTRKSRQRNAAKAQDCEELLASLRASYSYLPKG